MVKNLLSNEQDTSLIPGPRTKIPQASGQLSPCAITIALSERFHMMPLRPNAAK